MHILKNKNGPTGVSQMNGRFNIQKPMNEIHQTENLTRKII